MDELGKIVRPQSPTRTCSINPEDKSHIGLILSETKVSDKSGEKILSLRANEIVCALSSKTIYLSNTGQVISNIDLPYYWCNFCTFKSEDKHMLLRHLMEHRFSCQFCKFQTFSRIDVVRHMVKEHKDFEGGDLKFCVLLPDLLKQGLRHEEQEGSMVTGVKSVRESPNKTKSKKELDVENEQNLKRKREDSSSEDDSKKRTQGRNKAVRGRGKAQGRKSFTESGKKCPDTSSGEDEPPVTRRSTRSTPADDTVKNTTPEVCFECSLCKFRTFQKPILKNHTDTKHKKAKPSFSLKIVSRSQSKEIEENDKKLKPMKKSDKVEERDKASREEGRKTADGGQASKKKEGKKSSSADNDKKIEEMETQEDEENLGTPVVEMDYAEEDDDEDYIVSNMDDERDEDFIPSSEMKKSHFRKKVPSDMVTSFKLKPEVRQDASVVQAVPKVFKCLLCSQVNQETFSKVKDHYFHDHPGGSLIMSESLNGEEQWVYFCVTCPFKNSNPLPWLDHVKVCQKEAFEEPYTTNSNHDSVRNTANTVRENMTLIQQAYPSQPVNEVPRIKQEPVDDKEPEPVKYVYSSEPVPISITANKAAMQTTVDCGDASDTVVLPSAIPAPQGFPVAATQNPHTGRSNAAVVNLIMMEKTMNKLANNSANSPPPPNSTDKVSPRKGACSPASSAESAMPNKASVPTGANTAVSVPNSVNTGSPNQHCISENVDSSIQSNKLDNSKQRNSATAVVKPQLKSKTCEEENVPFDVETKGNYKCAHCRFLGCRALEIRTHMLERHRMNPLYGLDMLAEEKQVPRFMMFCLKKGCTFVTKGKDLFLKHLDTCASVEDGESTFTDEYKKRVEITRNFAAKTLQKLQSLTQQ